VQDVALAVDAAGGLHLTTSGKVGTGSPVTISSCTGACGSGASWVVTPVDSAPGGGFVSLALDAANHARIASSWNGLQYTRMKQ
jgi:hypothetical protein